MRRVQSITSPVALVLVLMSGLWTGARGGSDAIPEVGLPEIKAELLDDVATDGKVVYVDFWASWCAPCKKSFPWMQAMYEEFADEGLVIVAVNLDEHRRQAEEFLARADPSFVVRYDEGARLAKEFKLRAMPTALLFDREGRLVSRHEGFVNSGRAALRAEVEELLHVSAGPDRGK